MQKKQKALVAKLKSYFLRNQFAVRYGWISVRMLWSLTRVTLVFRVFSHQPNKVYFYALATDLMASFTEAWATGRSILAFVMDKPKAGKRFLILAVAMFVLPEVLLIFLWKGLPEHLVLAIGAFIIISLTIFLSGVLKKIRKGALQNC